MNLFFRVETRSQLLGQSDNDIVLIAADRVSKIKSASDGGSIIYHGAGETTVTSVGVDELLRTSVIDVANYLE